LTEKEGNSMDIELVTDKNISDALNKFMVKFKPMLIDLYQEIYPEDGKGIGPIKFYSTIASIVLNALSDMARVQKEDPTQMIMDYTLVWLSVCKRIMGKVFLEDTNTANMN